MKIFFILFLIISTPLVSASDDYPSYPNYPGYPDGGDHSDDDDHHRPTPDNQCRVRQEERQRELIDIELKGITRLTTDIMQSTPRTLNGQTYEMSIDGTSDYGLTLFPEGAFSGRKISNNTFLVTVVNANLLYSHEGGIFFSRHEEIEYRISLVNQAPIPECTDSFQKCLISVSFLYNNQLIDFEDIARDFRYDFFFNDSVVQLTGVSGSKVNFSRSNNGHTTVKTRLTSKVSGRMINIESKPLAMCAQRSGHGDGNGHGGGNGNGGGRNDDRPRYPRNPDRDHDDGHGRDHDHDRDYDRDHDRDHHDDDRRDHRREEIDHKWMRYKSTHVDILDRDDRFLSNGFTAKYRVVVSNPYRNAIECDVTIISSRGTNRKYEIIDTKVHRNVRIPARSSAEKYGEIEGKEGRGTNGLLWTTNYGHEVKASGCRYLR